MVKWLWNIVYCMCDIALGNIPMRDQKLDLMCVWHCSRAACVYGFYREQYGYVSSVQNHMMSEFKNLCIMKYYILEPQRVWFAKPLFSSVNNFLYIIYEYFFPIYPCVWDSMWSACIFLLNFRVLNKNNV